MQQIISVDICWMALKKREWSELLWRPVLPRRRGASTPTPISILQNLLTITKGLVWKVTDSAICQGSQEWIQNWSQASVLIKALPGSNFNIISRKYRCQHVLNTSK